MRERFELWLKIACLLLAGLLLYKLVRAAVGGDPLAHVSIPVLPSLPASTNASSGSKGTNSAPPLAAGQGTNTSTAHTSSVLAGGSLDSANGTNPPARPLLATGQGTNSSTAHTNSVLTGVSLDSANGTNPPARPLLATGQDTNAATAHTNSLLTGASLDSGNGTNRPARPLQATDTNSVLSKEGEPGNKTTNSAAPNRMVMAAMAPGARQMMGSQPPELPPAIRARVDRITDSELLGPVMRPMPLALLGIAGDVVFLRAPSGQTGIVKEGGDLGGIKLLHIGTNRVLVEQDGQKKELSIFEGFGGESLLPKPPKTANETTNR